MICATLAAIVALLLAWNPAAQAVIIPWSVAGVPTTVPADGGAYNLTVNLTATASSIDLTENVAQTIGLQDFNWSMSADALGTASAVVDRSLTVGGVSLTIDQDYVFGSSSAYGLIIKSGAFHAAPTLTFDLGNTGMVDVTLLYVTNPGGGGGHRHHRDLGLGLDHRYLLHLPLRQRARRAVRVVRRRRDTGAVHGAPLCDGARPARPARPTPGRALIAFTRAQATAECESRIPVCA
jgi:hypothetical protein